MNYRHKLTGEVMEFVKSYGSVYLMKGKEYKTVGRELVSDKYICHRDNLTPIEQQGKLF